MWPAHQLYNTLVEVDDSLQIKPSLARTWQFSADRKMITFQLRQDVFFHDDACFPAGKGRRLLASDIQYSFKRIIDEKTASPGAWIFNNKMDTTAAFTAVDDSTFILRLSSPFVPILGILSMQYCSIVPQEAVEKYGNDFRRHPVGSGPFKFVAWDEGQALILKKNEQYFETDSAGNKLPYLDGIKVSFLDSKATEFLSFQQKRIDFINDIDPSFKDEILTKTGKLQSQWKNDLDLQKHAYLNIEYLGILIDSSRPELKSSPLVTKKIRQAINYGINKKKMMLYLRNSIGTAAQNGFVPPGLPSYTEELIGYNYDVEKAKTCLREAGFPEGKNLPVIKLLTIPTYANLGSYIANDLKSIGINVQVEVIQKSLLLQKTSKSEAVFFRASWIADYPDAENYLSVFYGKNPAPPNYTRYNNPTYNKLYEEAIIEVDPTKRFELYRALDKLLMADAPVVPLWYDQVIHLVHKKVTGFTANALNLLELRRVKKE